MNPPETRASWGILGGAFDPVHNGHLHLARQMILAGAVVRVLLVPSFQHPFKRRFHADYSDRLAMLKLALEGQDRFELCEIEREEGLSGFTLDTIRAIKKRYPERRFSFIMGQDNLADFERWHQPEQLLSEVEFLVGSRPAVNDATLSPTAARMKSVQIEMRDVSSTDVRRLVKEGRLEEVSRLVPAAVHEYIARKGLYR